MLLMSSLAKQKHTGTIMLQTQIRHLLNIIDKLNLRESIDKDIYEDLVALNIDEIIEVEENGEIDKKSIYSMRGNYNSAVEAKIT